MPYGAHMIGISKREFPDEFYVPGIYAVVNTETGYAYIGYALNICHRWMGHRSQLRHNKHITPPLQEAWNIWGERAFRLEILEVISARADKLVFRVRERYHLQHAPYMLYNLSDEAVIRALTFR